MSKSDNRNRLIFDDETIQSLFGHEAAEDEDPARLRKYYLKRDVFEQVRAPLPLRILVAHKGVGKSALFKVAMGECNDEGRLALLIKPDDLVGLGTDSEDFLQRIRDWEHGLTERIAAKVFRSLGSTDTSALGQVKKFGGRLMEFLSETIKQDSFDLNPGRKAVIERALSETGIDVFIDDLDRGWLGRKEDILRISALLNAARDLTQENRALRFKISLRSDVYYLVRTSDESTDKIESSVVWQSWTNHEILVMLVKRIDTFFGRGTDELNLLKLRQSSLNDLLDCVLAPRFLGQGKWSNTPMYRVLMTVVRKRPRDIVKLLTLAGRAAFRSGADQITTDHLDSVFEEYSQGRLQDTINEFRFELPEIERLLTNMRPSRQFLKERALIEQKTGAHSSPYVFTTAELLKKIKAISERGEFRGASGAVMSPQDLVGFMYKTNFLQARKIIDGGKIVRRDFEQHRYLSSRVADFGFDWEVHPAYRWALQPERREDIYKLLDFAEDE